MKANPVLPVLRKNLASQDFYVRETANDSLFGPMTFQHAEHYARRFSMKNNSGLAEMVTRVGVRDGDPARLFPSYKVVYIYVRGRCIYGGRQAAYQSSKGVVYVP